DSLPLRVTGVFKDLPRNTHFQLDVLISTAGIPGVDIPSFDWVGYNYFKLSTNDFDGFYQEFQRRREEIFPGSTTGKVRPNIEIQPLSGIAFSNVFGNVFPVKSRVTLNMLQYISFLILILAWANYITLSIHGLNKRRKELGTRKTVGATARNIASQFLI